MSTRSWSVFREESGKVSASRVVMVGAMGAWGIQFLFWCIAVAGLFFNAWPWTRFEDAIMVGGAGLIGTLVLTIGGYVVNRRKNA